MIWLGVIDKNIIGPYIFKGKVDTQKYLSMLRFKVLPELRRIGKNSREIIYMHDGAPPHVGQPVRNFLTNNFYGWIGRGIGSILEWPPRSPDFNPLDFFVWGFMTDLVYYNKPSNIHELKMKIEEAVDNITPGMLTSVQINFMKRMEKCLQENGYLVEHLM